MRFAPNWKLTLFAVVFVPLLLSLGTWQGLRAAEKRGLEAARDAAAVLPAAMLEPTEAIPPGHLTPVRVRKAGSTRLGSSCWTTGRTWGVRI